MMTTNLAGGQTAILYVAKFQEYGIRVLDGGSGFIVIEHCPWCGKSLSDALCDTWFEEIDSQGFEVGDEAILSKSISDEWRRTRLSNEVAKNNDFAASKLGP